MEAYESLITRRSIRYYKDKNIEPEKVQKLLEAAMHAPSARNYQPWSFIVLDDKKIINETAQLHPYGDILQRAPLGILICGDTNIEPSVEYLVEDCSASSQNLLIAAHSLGLGACWLGVYPRKERVEKIKNYFDLPENIIPISLISIGYPAEEKKRANRFRESRIHYNGWNKKESASK